LDEATSATNRKIARVESADDPAVKVFVSNYWTLEYDLAATSLAEVMFLAVAMARMEKSRGERMTDADEVAALADARAAWPAFDAAHATSEALAIAIYQPLHEKEASKAVTAQYAAKLLLSKSFGVGQVLLDALPPYLKAALRHVTATSDLPAEELRVPA
jgi:putative ATP-dependent endonuclease of OLD family